MYKYILLDADNTLLDFDSAQHSCFKVVLEYYEVDYSSNLYSSYTHINHALWSAFERREITTTQVQSERFAKFFESFGRKINGIDANEIYQTALKNQCELMPYAAEVCKYLATLAKLVIVTNGVGETQKARIEKSEIAKYLSSIIVSEDIGFQKPDINFFNHVFLQLDKPNLSEMLIVGDSLSSDIKGGINAGIHTCYYNPNGRKSTTDIKPTYTISDLRELIVIIQ